MTSARKVTRLRVLVAGGGVAGLETVMALRSLAGPRTEIALLTPGEEFVYRPLAVGEPFGLGSVRRYPLPRIAADFGVELIQEELGWVAPAAHCAFLRGGEELPYEGLVLALGAHARAAWPHVPTFRGPQDVDMVRTLLDEIERREVESVAFVVPDGVTWALPLYELALLTAERSRAAGLEVRLALFTPEARPLAVSGPDASSEMQKLLDGAGVELARGAAVHVTKENDVVIPGEETPLRFERVLAVPLLSGPAPHGVPCDGAGFIPVDSHGLVRGVDHVYAAGDGTDFPIKQGGIAAQQADAVAEVIAKRAGAAVDPRPLRPVLRVQVLAGGTKRFLRRDAGNDGGVSEASEDPLWWPSGKIAGAHLGPYLAALDAAAQPDAAGTGAATGREGDGLRTITTWIEESPYGE
jgi:sulfide:quinone oxidoreductase